MRTNTQFLVPTHQLVALAGAGLLAALPLAALAAAPKTAVPGINKVTGLEISSDARGTHIVIEGSQAFTPEVRPLGGKSSATVIMVPGQWNAGPSGLTTVRRNGVWTVRYGQYSDSAVASTVRIVANTRQNLPTTARPSVDRRRWEVTVWAPGIAPESAPAAVTKAVTKPVAAAKALAPAKTVLPVFAPSFAAAANSAAASLKPQGEPIVASSAGMILASETTPAAVTAFAPMHTAVLAARVATVPPPAPMTLAAPVPAAAPRPRRAVAAASRPFTAPAGGEQGADSALRRVSLDFVAADINDVLKALSLQSGVNIVTGADVKGTITVTLKQVSLGDALDMVTRLSGFKYAHFGPAYVVGTPASVAGIIGLDGGEKRAEPVTEFIPFRYNTMANLTRALGDRFPGLKLPSADKEDAPSRPKTLIVTDVPSTVAEVKAFVDKMEQAVSVPTTAAATEVYRVRYASPSDLIDILGRLVPTLSVQLGPSPGFNSGSTGASAAYSAAPVSGLSGAGAGGASAGGGAGTSNPAGAKSSGTQPNAILLSGATADILRAREILAQIDLRVPQIQFEARVEDINRDDRRQLGLRYDFSRSVQIGEQNNQKDGTVGGVGTPVNDPVTVARDLTFGSILRTPYSITANLDALEKDNHAKTLASPNLSALDGQPAVVFIGDQIKYVINIQQTQQGQNIQTETATVGVTLKVTGKSSPDGTVTLYVHPEVSSVTSFQNLSNGISLPQIGTRFVDTTIRVKDGETIGIGGLIQESDVNNVQKVPILGDIPFFGQLFFRNSDKRKTRSEVIIFITTHILKD